VKTETTHTNKHKPLRRNIKVLTNSLTESDRHIPALLPNLAVKTGLEYEYFTA